MASRRRARARLLCPRLRRAVGGADGLGPAARRSGGPPRARRPPRHRASCRTRQ
jgi:hypothetical protein